MRKSDIKEHFYDIRASSAPGRQYAACMILGCGSRHSQTFFSSSYHVLAAIL